MSIEKKKANYYSAKEKPAREIRKRPEIVPYTSRDMLRDFDDLMNRFEHDFEDFWDASTLFGRDTSSKTRTSIMPFTGLPSVDIEDQGKNYCLTVDLPGFKKDDVQVEVTEDTVTINAKRSHAEDEQRKNYLRRERSSQTYYRRIPLPESIRSDEAKAALKDGLLEVTLPKKQPKETKKVAIS